MQKNDAVAERRALACRRMQVCGAGICAGAQVFLLGAGLSVSLCANGAWIAGLVSVPVSALAAGLCRGRIVRGRITRAGAALLAAAYFLCAVFACAALTALAEHSFLPQARALHIAVLTAAFAALCAACGAGVFRVCYLLRAALPAAAIVCAAAALPDKGLSGIFPLLGMGAGPIGLSALCMAAGCVTPGLILLIPPPDMEGMERVSVPGAGFYAAPAACGACAGGALLFLLCAGGTPQALMGADGWGAGLALIAGGGAHQGLADTALLCALCAGTALLAAQMLLSCARAVCAVFPRAGEKTALCTASLLLLAVLAALTARGLDAAAYAAPASALPAMAALIACRGKRDKRGGDAV